MDIGEILEAQAREIKKLRDDVDLLKRQETPVVSLQNAFLLAQDGRIGALETFSGARVYNSENLTIPHNTLTNLTFNSERFDTDSYHSTDSNAERLTVPVAGTYLILGNVRFANNATGVRQLTVILNNSDIIAFDREDASTVAVTYVTLSTIYELAAGDYVTLRVFQNSGGNLDVDAQASYSPEFMIARLG